MHVLSAIEAVGALSWDPQVRGAAIVFTAVVLLPGSVYMLLATNLGAKFGFLIAAAGLTGWMTVMGGVWTVFGIGLKGDSPTWHVEEVVTGPIDQSTIEAIDEFPRGWEKLRTGDPILGDAQASADKALVPAESTGAEHGAEGEAGAATAAHIDPVFKDVGDYVQVGGYRKGGDDYFIPGGYLVVNSGPMEGWLHKPHYAVIQVAPVLEEPDLGGAPPTPVPDPEAEITNVIMIRDLGSLRQNSALMTLSMAIVFGVICYVLHQRDLEIRRQREGAEAGTR